MDYILSGDPTEVEKVIKENRIRVERGVISFTPAPSVEVDNKDIPDFDSKDVPTEDTKEVKTTKTKRTKKAE